MKLLTSITLCTTLSLTFLNAQTTMCFKEKHKSMSTIEQTVLDGGLCSSKKTPIDMQNNGWEINDIKITTTNDGFNYIYIFKKNTANSNTTYVTQNNQELEAKIIAKLEKKRENEKIEKEIERKYEMAKLGEDKFTNKCQSCHGTNGEKKAFNTARPLKNLTLEEFKDSIRDYTLGTLDNGNAIVMNPYASSISEKDVENIYSYLNKINNK